MSELINKIDAITDKIKGSVIVIGLSDESIINKMNNNNSILEIDLLNYRGKNFEGKGGKQQFLPFKSFRKRYKKKGVDYIIGDINEVKKNLVRFISDNVYINSKTTYLYGKNSDVNLVKLQRDYETYGAKVHIEYYKDNFFATIDNTKSKENIITFFYHKISDRVHYVMDILGGL